MMEVVVTTGAIRRGAFKIFFKDLTSSQIVTNNKPNTRLFTGRMPFLSPNQQCQSTEAKQYLSEYHFIYVKIIVNFIIVLTCYN